MVNGSNQLYMDEFCLAREIPSILSSSKLERRDNHSIFSTLHLPTSLRRSTSKFVRFPSSGGMSREINRVMEPMKVGMFPWKEFEERSRRFK
ncbi:hypothetical protein LXL04_004570 [Taraxacum kok-saghyz]